MYILMQWGVANRHDIFAALYIRFFHHRASLPSSLNCDATRWRDLKENHIDTFMLSE